MNYKENDMTESILNNAGKATESSPSKRDLYIDIAKGIAIILVVIGHCFSDSPSPFRRTIYSFHIPLFFFLSGMVLHAPERGPRAFLNRISRRFYQLMIPYYIFALIYGNFSMKNLVYVLYASTEALKQTNLITVSYWFLPALFLSTIISTGVCILCWERKYGKLAIAILLFVCGLSVKHIEPYGFPFNADIVLVASGFMLLGNIAATYRNLLSRPKMLLILTVLFLLLFVLGMTLPNIETNEVDIYIAKYGNRLSFLFRSCSGIGLIVCVAALLALLIPSEKILSFIGRHSLSILLLHQPIVVHIQKIRIFRGLPKPLSVTFIVLIALLISLAIGQIIARFCPQVIGKNVPKTDE